MHLGAQPAHHCYGRTDVVRLPTPGGRGAGGGVKNPPVRKPVDFFAKTGRLLRRALRLLSVLAGLVRHAAAGLAGALAGGLALAAAAVPGAGAEITGLEGLYSLHVLHSNLNLAALCGNLLIIEYSMTADLSRGKAKFPAGADKRSI